jgi:hypothetical protein
MALYRVEGTFVLRYWGKWNREEVYERHEAEVSGVIEAWSEHGVVHVLAMMLGFDGLIPAPHDLRVIDEAGQELLNYRSGRP